MRVVQLLRDYDWLDNEKSFWERYGATVAKLKGKAVDKVYAVFDRAESEWFFDAPMLIKIEDCFLFVNVSNCCSTAVGINELFPNDKPIWFEKDCAPQGWQENLEWKEFEDVSKCYGERIKRIMPITAAIYQDLFLEEERGLNGILLELEHGKLLVHDNGDQIYAQYRDNC